MELRRLTYFLAVAEELHFGRAATRLNIAHPPLSRQIAALEADIGTLLFDRSRSQIRLTHAGEVLERHARVLVDRLEAAYKETRLVGEGGAGRLRVAFVGSASHGVLPNLIKSYRSHYPKVELALSAMNNAQLHSALVQREIDLAVARPALTDDELRAEPLVHEDLILAVPDNSEVAGRKTIRLAELADQTFVLYPADRARLMRIQCWMSAARKGSNLPRSNSPRIIRPRSALCPSALVCRWCRKAFHRPPAPVWCFDPAREPIPALA